jgi:hypothetical protein
MAHFAKVEDGIVTEVLVIDQEVIDTGAFGDPSLWLQTSYNTYGGEHPEGRPLRMNYAGVGYTYDAERDAFIAPQPFASWTLDDERCVWVAPIASPNDGKIYFWNEDDLIWVEAEVQPT